MSGRLQLLRRRVRSLVRVYRPRCDSSQTLNRISEWWVFRCPAHAVTCTVCNIVHTRRGVGMSTGYCKPCARRTDPGTGVQRDLPETE